MWSFVVMCGGFDTSNAMRATQKRFETVCCLEVVRYGKGGDRRLEEGTFL